MKKTEVNKFRCIILLTLFIGFFGSNLFFNHSHIVDGNIIVHSHPFKTGSDGKPLHSHPKSTYVLIQILNASIFIATLTASLASAFNVFFRKILFISYIPVLSKHKYLLLEKRGPPSVLLFEAA